MLIMEAKGRINMMTTQSANDVLKSMRLTGKLAAFIPPGHIQVNANIP